MDVTGPHLMKKKKKKRYSLIIWQREFSYLKRTMMIFIFILSIHQWFQKVTFSLFFKNIRCISILGRL